MKFIKTKALVACGLAASMVACSENEWNRNELEGFEVPEVTDVQTVEYTMTDEDYATVASLSANKDLAGDANASALKAVGTKLCFSEKISARDYVPAFLASSDFAYFTLDNGSAIKLTYRTSYDLPAEIDQIEAAQEMTVSDNMYQEVWGSENDYIAGFAPSHKASKELPSILASEYPDAVSGDYVIVKYAEAETDPVFTAPEEPVAPEFTLSNVIGTVSSGDNVTINGIVTALCTQGFIITDASGSIFAYRGSSFGSNGFENLKIGDQIVLTGEVSDRNKSVQINNGATFEIQGNQAVTYPSAVTFDAAKLAEVIARTDNATAIYGTMVGTVAVSGNNINILVDGSAVAKGSVYGATDADKALLLDGATATITGYLINIAGGKYCNMVCTNISVAGAAATAASSRAGVDVATTSKTAIYTFNGSKWVVPEGTAILSHADYLAMGQKYDNLSEESPAMFLPTWLKTTFPYSVDGDSKLVVYAYYSGSTAIRCDKYLYNGSEWTLDSGVTTETSQFVKTGGKWMYDPNVTITLPSGKGVEISTLYYQACVDWVASNIDKKTGASYVTKYGNNEYYSGTSAYQGNVDLRASAAKGQYAAGYDGMTDDEIVAKMKERFERETMPAALSAIHPDADVVPGIDVIYTINFSTYSEDKQTRTQVIKFKVVGKGKFEFVECDW